MLLEDASPAVPTLSIGMPAYNGERYVREALDSLLTQTYTDFELIISDNASTDSTEDICREYARRDSRIRYVRQEKNSGYVANFEFVLRAARGEYFTWAACDDLEASSDYLGEMVSTITNGNYDLVLPAVDITSTAPDGTSHFVNRSTMDAFLKCKNVEDYRLTTVHNPVFHIYGLYKREWLLLNFWYIHRAEERVGAFEADFLAHVASASLRLGYAPAARKIYRSHAGGVYATAYNPPQYLLRFLKYSRLLLWFWLSEADVPLRTKAQVICVILYWNGRGTLRYALRSVSYWIAQASASYRGGYNKMN